MSIEGRDLVDLDQGQAHEIGQRGQMARSQPMIMVLNEVQMLDQQVTRQRRIAKQCADVRDGVRVNLPSLGVRHRAATAYTGVVEMFGLIRVHLGLRTPGLPTSGLRLLR